MKRSWNTIFQIIAVSSQALNLYAPIMPSKWQLWASAVISITQGTVGVIAHSYNQDGTPQTTPFIPPYVPLQR